MDSNSLGRAIQSLCRLDHAGLLDEYLVDVAEASRGPLSDLDRHPEWKYTVAKLSRIAVQLFGVPAHQAREVAVQSLLPATRRSIALDVLDQYEQRLDEEQLKAQAARSIQRFNRRVGA
ncbi:hypothetical protein [Lacipirellula limnantheis]|uniref:Uncharacterized protein n=1 Tax=Lacipirellula limnantheis TaxID=2528024 RepID=A0A517U1E7_9BACT|nr:hypothetical protein [Lacipirellula limnantheis]QDT74437.1 hypothetical protein I41_36330 [Lacipirellula limnantheis]